MADGKACTPFVFYAEIMNTDTVVCILNLLYCWHFLFISSVYLFYSNAIQLIQFCVFLKQRVQRKLAVLNKKTKGGCSCLILLVIAIVILIVVIWALIKYLWLRYNHTNSAVWSVTSNNRNFKSNYYQRAKYVGKETRCILYLVFELNSFS